MQVRRQWQRGLAGLAVVGGITLASALPANTVLAGLPEARVQQAAAVERAAASYDTLFTVPVGSGSVEYAPKMPETEGWGPKAIAVAPDGSFVIANTYRVNLLRYSATGALLQTIDLSNVARGITALKVTPAGIFALDGAAQEPAVFHINSQGRVVGKHVIPAALRAGLSGLAIGSGGDVLLEHEGKIKHRLLQANGQPAAQTEARPEVAGQPLTIARPDWSSASTHGRSTITIGSKQIDINVAHMLGTPRLLGSHSARSFYVIVEEVTHNDEGAMQVDLTVRHYNLDGHLLGMTRFPLAEQAVVVDHPLTIGRDGAVYGLLARQDHVAVVRFNFTPMLEPVLSAKPTQPLPEKHPAPEGDVTIQAISRAQIRDKANQYNGYWKQLSSANVWGTCYGREKPRYFSSTGWAHSVAYDWGGWDDVGQYDSLMNQGYQAGDINTTVEGCSRGVDCSGFVTRAWYLGQKYGTSTLPSVSVQLSGYWQVKVGDIMNYDPYHVRLIESQNPDGMYAWEATTDAGYDRAIHRWLPLYRYSGYTPYRFYNLIDP
jgi:hypothetical protein